MGWYPTIARPALFALPPEAAHRLAQGLLGLPLPWERIGGVARDPSLRTTLAGIELANPVGLAAGFDKTGRGLASLGRLGFGFVVAGTFTRRPRTGNPRPRLVRYPSRGSLVNAMGLPNPGVEAAARSLAAATASPAPRFASIADEAVGDVAATHAALEPHVDAVELNASCPNVSWGRDLDQEAHLSELLRELRHRSTPLFVKLPPVRTEVERRVVLALATIAVEGGADGLVCSNTRRVLEPRLAVGVGGLSGRALGPETPRIVRTVAAAVGSEIPIVACGGIASARDAAACLDAGASAVQLYTALIYAGPAIVGTITGGLRERPSARRVREPA